MKSIAEAGRMLLGKMTTSSATRRRASSASGGEKPRGHSASTTSTGRGGRAASSSSDPIDSTATIDPSLLEAIKDSPSLQKKRFPYRANGTKSDLPTDDLLLVEQLAARRPGAALPRHWTVQEDEALRKAIEKYGERDWKTVADCVPGRNALQCVQRWKKTLMPGLTKGAWSQEEDLSLLSVMQAVSRETASEDTDKMDWVQVATRMPGRNAKQCKERWALYLDPTIERGPWTAEEDAMLIRLHAEIGGRWVVIAKNMRENCQMARTEHSVKTRYMSLVRQAARARGWSPEEDFAVCKGFLQEGPEAGSAIARTLVGRTKAQVNKRFEELIALKPFLNEMYMGPFPRTLTPAEVARLNPPPVPTSPAVSHVPTPNAEPPKLMQLTTSTGSIGGGHALQAWPSSSATLASEVTRLRQANELDVKIECLDDPEDDLMFLDNESPDETTGDLGVKLLAHALSSSEFAITQPGLDDLSYFDAMEVADLLATDQPAAPPPPTGGAPPRAAAPLQVTTSELYDELGMQRKAMRQYQSSLVSSVISL